MLVCFKLQIADIVPTAMYSSRKIAGQENTHVEHEVCLEATRFISCCATTFIHECTTQYWYSNSVRPSVTYWYRVERLNIWAPKGMGKGALAPPWKSEVYIFV